MRSPATGIGSCKTEFHLPRGKTMVAHIRRFVLFGSICRRIIKVLTSGTHIYAITGSKQASSLVLLEQDQVQSLSARCARLA